jgi:hypothetical protein
MQSPDGSRRGSLLVEVADAGRGGPRQGTGRPLWFFLPRAARTPRSPVCACRSSRTRGFGGAASSRIREECAIAGSIKEPPVLYPSEVAATVGIHIDLVDPTDGRPVVQVDRGAIGIHVCACLPATIVERVHVAPFLGVLHAARQSLRERDGNIGQGRQSNGAPPRSSGRATSTI